MAQSLISLIYKLYDLNIISQSHRINDDEVNINIDLNFTPKRTYPTSSDMVTVSRCFKLNQKDNIVTDEFKENTLPCVKDDFNDFNFYCRELSLQEFKKVNKKLGKTKKIT
jgi:hypothetical protein